MTKLTLGVLTTPPSATLGPCLHRQMQTKKNTNTKTNGEKKMLRQKRPQHRQNHSIAGGRQTSLPHKLQHLVLVTCSFRVCQKLTQNEMFVNLYK